MKAYSEDLRRKVVEARERGLNKSEVARLFGVSLSSVKRFSRRARERLPLKPGKAPGKRPKIDEPGRRLLELESKKRSLGASERDEWLRATWRTLVARELHPRRLVFVDEMGTNTSLIPLYAWARRGQRTRCKVPRNRGQNTTLLASMTSEGMGPCLAVVGSTTGAVFESYVEQVLSPTLRPGRVVVMDNLAAHKGDRVRELIEERGCKLLYLPPYSPDLNPIEEAFNKVKGLLRRVGARTREALLEALGTALDAVTAGDAGGFFEHCGYRLPGQPL
jgi:transposase